MSPEQVAGVEIDHRADLWSLAVVAFECLTGQLPFRADSLADLFAEIQRGPLPVPSRVDLGCPPELDRWWARAASRSLPARFASASALAHGLALALGIVEPSPEAPPLPERPPMRRSSLAAAGLALALGPLAGMLLGERIDGLARLRPSSVPARPAGDLDEASGATGLARPSIPPPVELVRLPDRPEAATREPGEPMPVRVPSAAVEHANAGRAGAAVLVPSKAARPPTGKVDQGPSPQADDLDFGF